jgi:membrane protease subunit HflC
VLLAEANSQSENIRGQGDAERNRIFADAYGKDADFFSFYRTMQAYERSMQHSDTHLVLRPDTDFFRFFNDPTGKAPPENATALGAAPPGAASASPENPPRASANR